MTTQPNRVRDSETRRPNFMRSATAFAPGSISGLFKIIADDDPEKMHSLGLSFTVTEGAEVTVAEATRTAVTFNGEEIRFPTVTTLARRLSDRDFHVAVESALPLSCGFGLSGASALAAAYAIDRLLGLGMAAEELALHAHVAEVENLTGLGDVCAQYHGGCLVKLRPGAPLVAQRLAVAEGEPIHFRYFGPISTREVLSDPDRRASVNQAADAALRQLSGLTGREGVAVAECVRISRQFAGDSGLMTDPRVREAVASVEASGGSASMIMLGHAVFSTAPFAGSTETALALAPARVLD